MVQPDTDGPRARRPRKERGKRSKNGCQTCLSKKVKCDERHPICSRCARLNLFCEWPIARPSLAERRRGFGPLKDRWCWTPRAIQPKCRESRVTITELQEESSLSALPNSAEDTTPTSHRLHGLDVESQTTEATGPQHMLQSSNTVLLCDDPGIDGSNVYEEGSSRTRHHQYSRTSSDAVPSLSSESDLTDNLIRAMGPSPTVLGSWETLQSKDMHALSFHRDVYAPLRSTQDSSRSAHTLFLHRAFDREMALHFLLAVSHNELAIYKKHGSTPQESRVHYRRGSELLQKQVDLYRTASTDHLNMMLSFLYIYLFWMRRSRIDSRKLQQISRTICNYVQLHTLDAVCSLGELLPPITNLPELAMTVSDQILLARILIYLYDRDGLCCSFGCGGTLANYVNSMPDKRQALWHISRIPFLWPMGGLDSIFNSNVEEENKYILDVYFELIVLHQDINCLSQNKVQDPQDSEISLRRHLDKLEKNVSFLSSLVAEQQTDAKQTPLMVYVATTVFYALHVYLDRSTTHGFGSTPVSLDTQRALGALMTVAYKTIVAGPVQLLERFQWALLIAGIETSDPIHREWIRANISDPGFRDMLDVVLKEKDRLGGTIRMATIRQLIAGFELHL